VQTRSNGPEINTINHQGTTRTNSNNKPNKSPLQNKVRKLEEILLQQDGELSEREKVIIELEEKVTEMDETIFKQVGQISKKVDEKFQMNEELTERGEAIIKMETMLMEKESKLEEEKNLNLKMKEKIVLLSENLEKARDEKIREKNENKRLRSNGEKVEDARGNDEGLQTLKDEMKALKSFVCEDILDLIEMMQQNLVKNQTGVDRKKEVDDRRKEVGVRSGTTKEENDKSSTRKDTDSRTEKPIEKEKQQIVTKKRRHVRGELNTVDIFQKNRFDALRFAVNQAESEEVSSSESEDEGNEGVENGRIRVVPGPYSSYCEAVVSGSGSSSDESFSHREGKGKHHGERNTLVISTSITRDINQRMFNSAYSSGRCRFQKFHGGKSHNIKDYIPTHLKHERPDSVLIQCGGNDLQDAYTPKLLEKLVDHIIDAGLICKNDNNVDTVFIGGVTLRRQVYTWERCRDLNRLLEDRCKLYGFVFVDNSNISLHHLHQDGVHLNLEGTEVMANNFLISFDTHFKN
jgi:hypothetical protein